MKFQIVGEEPTYKITSPEEAIQAIKASIPKEDLLFQEHFLLLPLNSGGMMADPIEIFRGGTAACMVDVPTLFRHLLLVVGCTGFIVAHNHPSSNLTPSMEDHVITRKLSKAAKIMGFSFTDHLILSPEGEYYSFNEHGELPGV